MNSRRLISVWYLSLVCLLCAPAWADKLMDRNATHYGKLFGITSVEVLFDPGCHSAERLTVPLADLISIDFDDNCQRPEREFISSPSMLPCPGEKATLFTITFKESGMTTARAIETVKDGQLEIAPYQAKTDIVGLLQEIRFIGRGPVCLQRITPSQWPDSFQRTPRKKDKPEKKE